ncbi:hypothetical protein Q8F55_007567 [Vanrija albida]|uniref:Alpha-acetolactate decarboxylase n=1 Tax=Vanrija albida TaxID=181172 RepID=A0ABR3PU46_9TREE
MKLSLLVLTALASTAAAGPIARGYGAGHESTAPAHAGKNATTPAHGSKNSAHKLPANEITQYSHIAALSAGVASNGTRIARVLAHGDLGLGTWPHIAGEMVVLDGVAYRATADGKVSTPPGNTQTPFAAVTRFVPERNATGTIANFSDFTTHLEGWYGGNLTHHFASYRLDGVWDLRIRAPGGQNHTLEPIAAVVARQTEFNHTRIAGTMVGFRTPKYAAEINAAGDHLHFISDDRSVAGHVLEFASVGAVKIQVAKVLRYSVEVPTFDEYEEATFA